MWIDSVIIRNEFEFRTAKFGMISLIKVEWKSVSECCEINQNYAGMIDNSFEINYDPPETSHGMKS